MYTHPKEVYNPVAYFAELAIDVQSGKLTLEDIQDKLAIRKTATSTAPKYDLSLYYIRLQELKNDYERAKEQYSHYESHFSQLAEENNISFEQAIKEEEQQDFWNTIVSKINAAHKAINEYVEDSPV